MKPIRIKDSKDFDLLLEALTTDYVYAESIYRQRVVLHHDLSQHLKVFEAAKTFWTLSLRAHDDSVLVRLCRIYDQHPASLSLRRFLVTIQDNLHIFDEANFRERYKGDPFMDSLVANAGRPDDKELAEDIEYTRTTNPLVAKLDQWRNHVVAHKDPCNIPGKVPLAHTYPLTEKDVADLLNQAGTILNRYRRLFKASSMSRVMEGLGDYNSIFAILNEHLGK